MWRARSQDEGSVAMQIPFTAFADDCTVNGEVALRTDRLSDFLATTVEFEVDRAAFKALDDGRLVETVSAAVGREDLCIVIATGPRGRAERRLWTRQHPVRVRVGPYTVFGYLHAPPTIDPMRHTDRRPIVALTACVVEYVEAGAPVRIEADVVLVNSAKIEHLESASEQDVGFADRLDLGTTADPAPAI
jgi:hypothetical protein